MRSIFRERREREKRVFVCLWGECGERVCVEDVWEEERERMITHWWMMMMMCSLWSFPPIIFHPTTLFSLFISHHPFFPSIMIDDWCVSECGGGSQRFSLPCWWSSLSLNIGGICAHNECVVLCVEREQIPKPHTHTHNQPTNRWHQSPHTTRHSSNFHTLICTDRIDNPTTNPAVCVSMFFRRWVRLRIWSMCISHAPSPVSLFHTRNPAQSPPFTITVSPLIFFATGFFVFLVVVVV